jgi:hypothetical protein
MRVYRCLLGLCLFLIGTFKADPGVATSWPECGVPITANESLEDSDQRIAPDGAGGAIVVWNRWEDGHFVVYAQRVDPNGNAMWNPNGVVVCDLLAESSIYPQVVSDGSGGAIIAWNDFRNATIDIWAQRIGATGNVVWPAPEGMPICTASGDQRNSRITTDGGGGAIIVWEDGRGSYWDIYAQRVGADGYVLWPADGVPICTANRNQLNPVIAADEAGGAYIAWRDNRAGGATYDIFAMAIKGDGTRYYLWPVNGRSVCVEPSGQGNVRIASGGPWVYVVWGDNRNEATTGLDIYGQRIQRDDGWDWGISNGVAICSEPGDQIAPEIATDLITGAALVTWLDERDGDGDIDIYAQRASYIDGAPHWGAGGIGIATYPTLNPVGDPTLKRYPKIVPDFEGGAIITWYDGHLNPPNTDWMDVLAQKVDVDGNIKWWPSGLPVCRAHDGRNYQENPEIVSDGNHGAIIAWRDGPEYSAECEISARRIDAAVQNVNVSTSYNSSTDKWNATFTFRTDYASLATVYQGPRCTSEHDCSYNRAQVETVATKDHSVTLTDVIPSELSCYKITASIVGSPSETVEDIGGFGFTGGPARIYNVSHSFISQGCQIRVLWKTKFLSRENKVMYRVKATPPNPWWSVNAVQTDCDQARFYTAFIPTLPRTRYEFKISTKMGDYYGTYESSIMERTTDVCQVAPPPIKEAPTQTVLSTPFVRAYPNPFNPTTTVSFNVPSPANVELKVFSADGKYVSTLASGPYDRGVHNIEWDATSARGEKVSSGIYFIKLTVGQEILTSKVVLLK